ncbi:hypothetical protein C8F04DRAFT_1313548, partial [Mycena alexandri]
ASRIVAVFGATGLQGSAVINRLLEDGNFTPRAITRDTHSEAALTLKERGVEVVQGDSGDKASLVSALRESEAVFAVIWLSFVTFCLIYSTSPQMTSPGTTSEVTQGKNIIDAAKEADAKSFIFSSLPSLSKLSSGKYNISSHHRTNELTDEKDKAEVEICLKASGLPNVFLLFGGFAENFWRLNFLKKTSTGFNITLPKYNPTAISAFTWIGHDLGEATLAVLKSYTDPSKEVSGKSYPVVTAQLTWPALAAMTSQALGVEVIYTCIPSSGIPPLDNLCEARSKYELYSTTPVPNPDLVALEYTSPSSLSYFAYIRGSS